MKLEQIRKRAKELGIKTDGLTKKELINTIQIYEGNYPCFGSAVDYCDRLDCCWREDCLG
ncbi:MAG: hypothetical protein JXJ04_12960 [Spirochaetales bacterium]|nr:hypothetical protein [Spirochaetales bacterium]